MFFVDLPSPGVRVVRTPAYAHTISHHHPIVAFGDVRVPAANLVGAEGDGMRFAYEWFRFERLMVAARCLGAADRLTGEMTAFAKERRAGGGPIIEHGLVAGMLADSLTELFAARAMLYETARGIDAKADVKVSHAQCSMAKLYCSEMAGRVADRAVQVFGGRGNRLHPGAGGGYPRRQSGPLAVTGDRQGTGHDHADTRGDQHRRQPPGGSAPDRPAASMHLRTLARTPARSGAFPA